MAQLRENVQKKTFTRWANMSLSKKDKIGDLFEDFKSGDTLLKLVNILAGSNLRPERGLSNLWNYMELLWVLRSRFLHHQYFLRPLPSSKQIFITMISGKMEIHQRSNIGRALDTLSEVDVSTVLFRCLTLVFKFSPIK